MIVRWLPAALLDRERQFRYIFTENPRAAIALDNLFRDQAKLLADHPDAGRVGRLARARELIVQRTSFLLIYRSNKRSGTIEILRLLHGAQQWPPKR